MCIRDRDMVGHSGNLRSTIKACEFVDKQLSRIYEAFVQKNGGIMIVTADHGNAEEMLGADGKTPKTSHTTNPVPFILITQKNVKNKYFLKDKGGLANVAPTIFHLWGIKPPKEMSGSLLK